WNARLAAISRGQKGETPAHEAGSPGSHCQATQAPAAGSWATQSPAAPSPAAPSPVTVLNGRGTRKPGSRRAGQGSKGSRGLKGPKESRSRYRSAVQRATRGSPAGLSTTSPDRQAVPWPPGSGMGSALAPKHASTSGPGRIPAAYDPGHGDA